MKRNEFLKALDRLSMWSSHGRRAPHKPLLLLLALGRVVRGRDRLARYQDWEKPLIGLLKRFGPPRKAHHPEFPFGRLRNDGEGRLWEIPKDDLLSTTSSGDLHRSALVEREAVGGFTEPLYDLLAVDHRLVHEAAEKLLDGHFPRSLHDDIRGAIGIPYRVADAPYSPDAAGRDPAFRDQVLREYERRCAVCGFDVRIQEELLGLEAAHIKWHAAGGPDIVQNGLALCVIHHKALDRGAIGLESRDQGFKVLISSEVHGQSEAVEWLRDFHDRPLRPPQSSGAEPGPEFVKWHTREVFREPAWRPGPVAARDRAGC